MLAIYIVLGLTCDLFKILFNKKVGLFPNFCLQKLLPYFRLTILYIYFIKNYLFNIHSLFKRAMAK
jgi:hypothetical protein